MDWFKRYGIPGTYFYGISILWFAALYDGKFDEVLKSDNLKIIVGIAATSFLPIGYLVSVIGEIIYHCFPGIGIDTRARKKVKGVIKCWWKMEWKEEVLALSEIMGKVKEDGVDKTKFIFDWMSKRMDMIVINSSLIIGTLLSGASVLIFPRVLGVVYQKNNTLLWITIIIGLTISFISAISWFILTNQLAHCEANVLLACNDSEEQGETKRQE